jgi:cell division protein FtsB
MSHDPQGIQGEQGVQGVQGIQGVRGVQGQDRIGVLGFALACLCVSLLIAGVAVTFALTNRVSVSDLQTQAEKLEATQAALEKQAAETQEGRRIGIAGICSIEKALIETGGETVARHLGFSHRNPRLARLADERYKSMVAQKARREARRLGAGDLPEVVNGTIDCQAFAVRSGAESKP